MPIEYTDEKGQTKISLKWRDHLNDENDKKDDKETDKKDDKKKKEDRSWLEVPLMSISKQVEDVLNKIELIKAMIMKKAKDVLKKIKSISAPELYITKPKEFKDIMEVLVEVQFILSHMPTVLDKLFNYFINFAVEQFTKILDKTVGLIQKALNAVIKLVPPLKKVIDLLFGINNQADYCFNTALNTVLP